MEKVVLFHRQHSRKPHHLHFPPIQGFAWYLILSEQQQIIRIRIPQALRRFLLQNYIAVKLSTIKECFQNITGYASTFPYFFQVFFNSLSQK